MHCLGLPDKGRAIKGLIAWKSFYNNIKTFYLEPLAEMMCQVPEDVTFATYRAVEGVVTPNGALHGTILEYNCNIGYRYSINLF